MVRRRAMSRCDVKVACAAPHSPSLVGPLAPLGLATCEEMAVRPSPKGGREAPPRTDLRPRPPYVTSSALSFSAVPNGSLWRRGRLEIEGGVGGGCRCAQSGLMRAIDSDEVGNEVWWYLVLMDL